MKITLIAAIAKNYAIGRDGDMLYHISADLKRFKQLTMGRPLIMGRKTFESLPSALPGRRNIVITRDSEWSAPGAETAPSIECAIEMCGDVAEAMVIGGGNVYRQMLPHADELQLTVIDASPEGADTYFPEIDMNDWELTEESEPQTDPRSGCTYRFICLSRK